MSGYASSAVARMQRSISQPAGWVGSPMCHCTTPIGFSTTTDLRVDGCACIACCSAAFEGVVTFHTPFLPVEHLIGRCAACIEAQKSVKTYLRLDLPYAGTLPVCMPGSTSPPL